MTSLKYNTPRFGARSLAAVGVTGALFLGAGVAPTYAAVATPQSVSVSAQTAASKSKVAKAKQVRAKEYKAASGKKNAAFVAADKARDAKFSSAETKYNDAMKKAKTKSEQSAARWMRVSMREEARATWDSDSLKARNTFYSQANTAYARYDVSTGVKKNTRSARIVYRGAARSAILTYADMMRDANRNYQNAQDRAAATRDDSLADAKTEAAKNKALENYGIQMTDAARTKMKTEERALAVLKAAQKKAADQYKKATGGNAVKAHWHVYR